MAVNTDESPWIASCLPLTSCCVAQFLKGHGPWYQFMAQGLRILDLEPLTLEGLGFPAPAPGALECRAYVYVLIQTWKEMENLSSRGSLDS